MTLLQWLREDKGPVVALVVRTGRNCRPGSLLEASVGTRVGAFALGPSYRLWVTPTHSLWDPWARGEGFSRKTIKATYTF